MAWTLSGLGSTFCDTMGDMDRIVNTFANEPALAVSLVAAILGVLVAFGVPLTEDQRESLLALVAIAGPILTGAVIRSQVKPK